MQQTMQYTLGKCVSKTSYTKGIQKVEGTLKRNGTTTDVHFIKERQKKGQVGKKKIPHNPE